MQGEIVGGKKETYTGAPFRNFLTCDELKTYLQQLADSCVDLLIGNRFLAAQPPRWGLYDPGMRVSILDNPSASLVRY